MFIEPILSAQSNKRHFDLAQNIFATMPVSLAMCY